MADFFAVGAENLTDTHMLSDFRAKDAALVEPLACVCKAMKLTFGAFGPDSVERCAVIGLGGMGLLHMLCLPRTTVGYDLDPSRQNWCTGLGLIGKHPSEVERADVVFVCPGSQAAFDFALSILEPGGTIVCFAPLGPGQALAVPQSAYFSDVKIVNSYSCGPDDVAKAIELLRSGAVRAEQVCSHFIELDELPIYYRLMKSGEILKPMVVW
jgi:L-iditol 2-dehydrogenase